MRECKFDVVSCPASPNASHCDDKEDDDARPYCACGYAGPQCPACSGRYFESWSGLECHACDDGANFGPTIGLAVVIFLCGLLVAGVVYAKRSQIQGNSYFKQAEHFAKIASVKLSLVFFMCQVVSQFAGISSASGASGRQPQPARTFAGVLGATNLDVLRFGKMILNCTS